MQYGIQRFVFVLLYVSAVSEKCPCCLAVAHSGLAVEGYGTV